MLKLVKQQLFILEYALEIVEIILLNLQKRTGLSHEYIFQDKSKLTMDLEKP